MDLSYIPKQYVIFCIFRSKITDLILNFKITYLRVIVLKVNNFNVRRLVSGFYILNIVIQSVNMGIINK